MCILYNKSCWQIGVYINRKELRYKLPQNNVIQYHP